MDFDTLIYLDNNATTPLDEKVFEAMLPYFKTNFANASSTHIFGVEASDAVKAARKEIAELIGAETNEIIFTSGATEAINLAIKGVAEAKSDKGKHIITLKTEHSAVLDTCKYLEAKGYEITYLEVNTDGLINIESLSSVIREDTILVSVMLANNETGVIQPIKEISSIAHSVDAVFMSDCTQAVGKIPIDVDSLGIDLLCLSGHKLYGPKGIGALYIRQRGNKLKIPALLHGGGHERGFRSGTLNVPGIVGLGKACSFAKKEMIANEKKIRELRDYLEESLLQLPDTSLNGSMEYRLFNTSNIRFSGIDSDALIMALSNVEIQGQPIIAVSNGSACTSTSIEPSHVLTAMGLSDVEAFNSIRFSLGRFNSKDEISKTISEIKQKIENLRQMAF